MNGEVKISRIKAQNKAAMDTLASALAPEVLSERVPRLGEVAEARRLHRSRMNEIQQWGKLSRASGFLPGGTMQYVAQIDQAVWSVILDMFARYDEHGNFMDDGLLFKSDEKGQLKLNRPFFYALVDYLQSNGYECDMRGKIKLT